MKVEARIIEGLHELLRKQDQLLEQMNRMPGQFKETEGGSIETQPGHSFHLSQLKDVAVLCKELGFCVKH